jgi:hypothetical protein
VDALTSVSEVDRDRGERARVPTPGFLGARYADGHSASEDDRLVPARPPAAGRPLVYGRATRDDRGRPWLQYWLFFTANTQDRGLVRTGRHRGDWELVQLRLGRDDLPVETTFAQHSWAEGCAWTEIERAGSAPIVYVANGSHALYPRAGRSDRPFPDPNDEADGRGRRVRPPVHVVDADSPRWMTWPGRWGEDDGGWVPGEEPSPRGPAFQPEAEVRACGSGPPGRPWQTVLTLVVAVGVALAGLLALRRSYNREP